MINQEFLALLRCPVDHGPLENASAALVERVNSAIEEGRLQNRAGQKVDQIIDGGLVNEARTLLYPVQDQIPCLLIDEAIPLDQLPPDATSA